jgi:twitching motility protein PilT
VLLEEMIERQASDLHLQAGVCPKFRIDGQLRSGTYSERLTPKRATELAYSVLTQRQKNTFELEHELDFSFGIRNLARFRANCVKQRGCVGMVVRLIPYQVRTLSELGLPASVGDLAERRQGLVLVTGPPGSGKSATLAAMIDKINRERQGHIITIEDPIEYIHAHQNCVVIQREVGSDTSSFSTALRSSLREDPDVIMLGEMLDVRTISAALTIAETGHLVLASMNTNSAAESVSRIIDAFPPEHQAQVRAQLAFALEGAITQQLVKLANGHGRTAAAEVMLATNDIRALIRRDEMVQVGLAMAAEAEDGMQTMNDSLSALFLEETVSREDCLKASPNSDEFLRLIGETTAPDRGFLSAG